MLNICKIEWNLSRNGMIIKLFSWGCVATGEKIVYIWPCLKPYYCQTTLLNNPNISGMLVTLTNIEKMTLSTLWLSKVEGHGHPKLTVSSSCYKFSKIFKPRPGFNSWWFSLIFERIVVDTIIFDLRKFYCKISKGLWDILGQNGTKWKNWKWGTFVASVIHDHSENLHWKNIHIFIMIWQVYRAKFMNGSKRFHRKKHLTKFVQNLQILCNTEVLIFTIFHYIIVIQARFTNSLLNSRILLCLVQSHLLV